MLVCKFDISGLTIQVFNKFCETGRRGRCKQTAEKVLLTVHCITAGCYCL